MTLATLFRFLLGCDSAIREIASDRSALWTAIVLTLLTGIARNYDQTYFLETPFWLIGPILFSFFSGGFLYLILIKGFAREHFEEKPRGIQPWRAFMTLFWMTAPIAWLYAVPVERFVDRYQATQLNLLLLAVVSLWRVLLMSRILQVLLEVDFLRSILRVLLAASIEVIVVLLIGLITSGAFSKAILAGMMGMRNAPEEDLLLSTLGIVWCGAFGLLLCSFTAILFLPLGSIPAFWKTDTRRPVPWRTLSVLTAIWIVIAIPAQREQFRFYTHANLIRQTRYAEAVAYLGKHAQSDFPPSRRLEPNPYETRIWKQLPPTVATLNSKTTPWVRDLYLSYFATTFHHGYTSQTNFAAMILAIEQLREGGEWVRSNQVSMVNNWSPLRQDSTSFERTMYTNMLAALRRMGVAETNLSRMAER